MPTVAYQTVDVFTATRFGGNPLAVLLDARGLDGEDMQRIAREFNYSETTFVLPPRDPANTAHVRIFTPTNEIPFAGHPNVGTAFVLAQLGEVFGQPAGNTLRFEEAAGLVEVKVLQEAGEAVGAQVVAPRALEVGAQIGVETIAACASLPPSALTTKWHTPVMVSVGLPFVVAEVADLEALVRAKPNLAAFTDAEARHPHPDDRFSLFLYVRVPKQPEHLRARMFAPLSNTFEDPATGSASAALGAYLYTLRPEADVAGTLELEQGVEMGRRSLIHLHVEKTVGVVRRVAIEGHCVGVMQGTIEV